METEIIKLKEQVVKLRNALIGFLGTSDKEQLQKMEAIIRLSNAPEQDKIVAINAIHAFLETE